MGQNLIGTQDLFQSASGYLGRAGLPVRVYFGQLISNGSPSVCPLYDGLDASKPEVLILEASGSYRGSSIIHTDAGVRMPSGCYYITDANCKGGSITFDTEF